MNKRALTSILVAATAIIISATATAGEKSFGVRGGYITRNSAPIAGLWFEYSFSDHLRLSPNIDYHFRHNNTDALAINCNMQFPFSLALYRKVQAYPFAGINYTSWNYHHDTVVSRDLSDDVTSRLNRFGINAGAGLEFRVSSTMKISLEAKATFIKSYTSGCFTLGLGYCF